MKASTLIAAAALLASGCQLNCIEGTGPVEQRTLEVPAFTSLEVDGAFQVKMEKGAAQSVTVSGQPNLIDLVQTKVSGGTWTIGTSKCWSSAEDITVHIVTPGGITAIEVNGSADVATADVFGTGSTTLATHGSGSLTVDGINVKHIEAEIAGSGTITLRGTCGTLEGDISGSGDLHGRDLAANEADLEISGSGTATITAISKLNADVAGSGEVHYAGKPVVQSDISGSGSVTPLP